MSEKAMSIKVALLAELQAQRDVEWSALRALVLYNKSTQYEDAEARIGILNEMIHEIIGYKP